MTPLNREQTLLDIIRQGIVSLSQKQTQRMLGDRTTYLGMSDLSRYAECPRAAIADKLHTRTEELSRVLTLQRGHWFEQGVHQALTAFGLHPLCQLEIAFRHNSVPIRVHLDFTLIWDGPLPAVRILEVKSTERLPDNPFPAHHLQAQAQAVLLEQLWNEPVFSLKDENGTILHENLDFPALCSACLGKRIPDNAEKVSIECWLLYLSMCDARAFGPYVYSAETLDEIVWLADSFWKDWQMVRENPHALGTIACVQGFHPLCARCESNSDCPKFPQSDYQPQWNCALVRLEELKGQRSTLNEEIREMEDALKQAHKLSGTQDWIGTGQYRFRCTSVSGRRTLNREGLQHELEEIFRFEQVEDIDVDALIRRHEHESAASSRLVISHLN